MAESFSTIQQSERTNIEIICEFADVLNALHLTMIEMKHGDRKIRLVRDPTGYDVVPWTTLVTTDAVIEVLPTPPVPESDGPVAGDTVRASIVGKVHLGPQDDSAPFACKGQNVSAGDTLLVIEAMKVMNPMIAHRSGIVANVFVKNGGLVEYDQPLMIIR